MKIFVEGGGPTRATQNPCRAGFSKYIEKIVPGSSRKPAVIACGGRQQAYDDFCRALKRPEPDCLYVLLVDSEDLVEARHALDPWPHLLERDGWVRPEGAVSEQAQLMVVVVEAWLVSDPDALESWYGKGFRKDVLPVAVDIETVQKPDLYDKLARATKATKKGDYGKGDAFELVGRIDPSKVEARCKRFAPRFHALIRTRCG